MYGIATLERYGILLIIIKKWIDHFTIFAVMAMLVDGELLYVIVLKTIQLGTDIMRKNYTKNKEK